MFGRLTYRAVLATLTTMIIVQCADSSESNSESKKIEDLAPKWKKGDQWKLRVSYTPIAETPASAQQVGWNCTMRVEEIPTGENDHYVLRLIAEHTGWWECLYFILDGGDLSLLELRHVMKRGELQEREIDKWKKASRLFVYPGGTPTIVSEASIYMPFPVFQEGDPPYVGPETGRAVVQNHSIEHGENGDSLTVRVAEGRNREEAEKRLQRGEHSTLVWKTGEPWWRSCAAPHLPCRTHYRVELVRDGN